MATAFTPEETGASRVEHSLLAALSASAIVEALTSPSRVVIDATQEVPVLSNAAVRP